MQNIKDLAASSAKTWGEIAQVIDNNFKGTTDPQKNDLNYVRALDASGNPILISKADLASVVGELLPIVSFTEKGLVPAGSLMCSDISGDFSPKYIILELIDSSGTNLIIDLPKPAGNSLLFVNALNNGSSTDIQSCNVKVLGNAISYIESIRYIKGKDSKYYIEIKLNNGYYMDKIGIYALAKSIKGAMASKTPFDDSNIANVLEANISSF